MLLLLLFDLQIALTLAAIWLYRRRRLLTRGWVVLLVCAISTWPLGFVALALGYVTTGELTVLLTLALLPPAWMLLRLLWTRADQPDAADLSAFD